MRNMNIVISVSDEGDQCVNIQQEFPPIPIGFFELEDALEFIKVVVRKFKDGEEPWNETAKLKQKYERSSYGRDENFVLRG
jgi:midasin (ATPase involved in ribosome maturation)